MGLLLLRSALGISLLLEGWTYLADRNPWMWVTGLLAIVTGALLLIGLVTPVAGILAAFDGVGVALSWLPSPIPDGSGAAPATAFFLVMAAAVLLLGPGAFSLDARLFGRREVVIPPASGLPEH